MAAASSWFSGIIAAAGWNDSPGDTAAAGPADTGVVALMEPVSDAASFTSDESLSYDASLHRQPTNQPIKTSCGDPRYTNTHTRLTALGTTRVSRYLKGKTNLDFTEARDSEWQWHQLGHMQVCISLQTDNHASTPPLSFLPAECNSCRPTNSVKALKAKNRDTR